jgi:hypothetical protein
MLKYVLLILLFTLLSCNTNDKTQKTDIKQDSIITITKEYSEELDIENCYDFPTGYLIEFEPIDNINVYNEEIIDAFLNDKIANIQIELYHEKNDKVNSIAKYTIPFKIMKSTSIVKGIKTHKAEIYYDSQMPLNGLSYNYEMYLFAGHSEYDVYKIGREYKVLKLKELKITIPEYYSDPEQNPYDYDKYSLNLMDVIYQNLSSMTANKTKLKLRININYTVNVKN